MTDLIHELNREGMPGFSLQILKQKVQNEYVLMEREGDDQELPAERFKQLFNQVVKTPISSKTKDMLWHAVSDKDNKMLEYELFNRLCDLFFFVPGTVFKRKNDSENLYLIMSSMARKKASIL